MVLFDYTVSATYLYLTQIYTFLIISITTDLLKVDGFISHAGHRAQTTVLVCM